MVSLTERKFASKLRIYLEQGARFEGAFRIPDLPLSVPWLIARDSLLGGDTGREYTDEFGDI